MKHVFAITAAIMLAVAPVVAQQVGKPIRSEPQPVAAAPALPALRDVAYPGTLTLEVDATDLDRRIFGRRCPWRRRVR